MWRAAHKHEACAGDLRAHADHQIVTKGAYALLRHLSYSAGILMNLGIGLALDCWASVLVPAAGSFAVHGYRMAVEERALLAAVGEPYRDFMRTRKRLIPCVYWGVGASAARSCWPDRCRGATGPDR